MQLLGKTNLNQADKHIIGIAFHAEKHPKDMMLVPRLALWMD